MHLQSVPARRGWLPDIGAASFAGPERFPIMAPISSSPQRATQIVARPAHHSAPEPAVLEFHRGARAPSIALGTNWRATPQGSAAQQKPHPLQGEPNAGFSERGP